MPIDAEFDRLIKVAEFRLGMARQSREVGDPAWRIDLDKAEDFIRQARAHGERCGT